MWGPFSEDFDCFYFRISASSHPLGKVASSSYAHLNPDSLEGQAIYSSHIKRLEFVACVSEYYLKKKEFCSDCCFFMGNCLGQPAKCAHASSNMLSGRGLSSAVTRQDSTSSGNKDTSKNPEALPTSNISTTFSNHLKSYTLSDLKNAAKNFRSDSLIGEGGFGYVFKGWIDKNTLAPAKSVTGMVVAIKKLKKESFQGHKEWLAEVNYLGQLHHENLVELIGYCSEAENRLLVYEFLPKGSLENHLFRKGVEPLDWPTRMNIAIGVARGLSFLHGLDANVIYRDLKAANILLDSDFKAKLSDFGLARDGPTGDKTHVSTRVIGTRGYAAPEYVATGRLTPKSDVYGYGVVLLELLTGKPAMEDEANEFVEETLVEWAKPFLVDNRRVLRIMDTRLCGRYANKEAKGSAALALRCLHSDPKNRPPMTEVLATLEKLKTSKQVPRSSPNFYSNVKTST